MQEFIRGWKRKVGCVTLVMACLFAALWVRSQFYLHELGYLSPSFASRQLVTADRRGLTWCKRTGLGATPLPEFMNFYWRSYRYPEGYSPQETPLVRVICGFRFGYEKSPFGSFAFWTVPYWPIVLPLTILSGWLLLSQPRKQNSKSPEPAEVIGV